jgi:uncharacterized Ntn-hydrolase superfamily protein
VTLSIVARDAVTRQFGIATTSFVLAVGAAVPHVRAGVGAVAIQAGAPLRWGEDVLDALSLGAPAAVVAAQLSGRAELEDSQVALVDQQGRTAVISGTGLELEVCIEETDHVCVAGNLMEQPTTARHALEAFRSSSADTLAGRLLDALVAADALGGDVRGRQSAALRVAPPVASNPGLGVDLRVDDARDPVKELQRLHRLRIAHDLLAASRGPDGTYRDVDLAMAAHHAAPLDQACLAGAALAMLRDARVEEAVALLRRLQSVEPRTAIRLARLRDHGLLDADLAEAAISRLL